MGISEVMQRECRILGLNSGIVGLVVEDEMFAERLGGKYLIHLPSTAKPRHIRHELYHVFAGHCDRRFNLLYYLGEEIQAILYGWFGINCKEV